MLVNKNFKDFAVNYKLSIVVITVYGKAVRIGYSPATVLSAVIKYFHWLSKNREGNICSKNSKSGDRPLIKINPEEVVMKQSFIIDV